MGPGRGGGGVKTCDKLLKTVIFSMHFTFGERSLLNAKKCLTDCIHALHKFLDGLSDGSTIKHGRRHHKKCKTMPLLLHITHSCLPNLMTYAQMIQNHKMKKIARMQQPTFEGCSMCKIVCEFELLQARFVPLEGLAEMCDRC